MPDTAQNNYFLLSDKKEKFWVCSVCVDFEYPYCNVHESAV